MISATQAAGVSAETIALRYSVEPVVTLVAICANAEASSAGWTTRGRYWSGRSAGTSRVAYVTIFCMRSFIKEDVRMISGSADGPPELRSSSWRKCRCGGSSGLNRLRDQSMAPHERWPT